jgi:hypothetical protein
LIFWNDTVGMSFLNAIDTFNKMWPVIEYAHLNHIGELLSLPNDAYFLSGDQAGLHPTVLIPDGNININPAWDQSVGRDIIKVGVFDSGINWDHEDFSEDNSGNWNKSRIKGGWDYKNNVHVSNSTTVDLDGHGTAIAGIIGAIRNNDRGVAGIGGGNGALNQWGVELYDLKIAENNAYVKESDIANAVTEGSSSFNGNFGYSLNVQNHSWRAFSLGEATKEAFRFSYRNSVVIAAASGNFGGAFDELFPASFNDKWILKVGANDENGVRLSTSSYGFSLDFLAPGTANLYAAPDANSNTTYNTYNQPGTSFSTPHAAGLASLMLSNINAPSSAPNNLAPEDVDTLIKKFANDVLATGVGWDNETGYGIINAGATLQGIQLPRFEIRHYNSTFNNNLASKISSNISLVLNETTEGVKAGTYNGDVYEITRNFNISQPTGRTILDVWTRNSNSTLFASHPIVPEVNCSLTSWNQSTATMKGYIYYLNTNSTGQKINKWFPSSATGLNGTGKMAITVYSDDPLSNGNQNGTPMDKLFNIAPNPSQGIFSIQFNLIKQTDLNIEITDMTGKIMYYNTFINKSIEQQELNLELSHLNQGLYVCNLRTTHGTISKKIMIIK